MEKFVGALPVETGDAETQDPGYTPEVFSHVLFAFRQQGSYRKVLSRYICVPRSVGEQLP